MGAIWFGRWQLWQLFCKTGSTSLLKVTGADELSAARAAMLNDKTATSIRIICLLQTIKTLTNNNIREAVSRRQETATSWLAASRTGTILCSPVQSKWYEPVNWDIETGRIFAGFGATAHSAVSLSEICFRPFTFVRAGL